PSDASDASIMVDINGGTVLLNLGVKRRPVCLWTSFYFPLRFFRAQSERSRLREIKTFIKTENQSKS
ncbi:MAG TPA: hypothetical protein VFA77_10835, partial [Candidatus Eisenbacteria bacterium]|nr:hypothetical protein [Candidatus Eisenbacteria bacterium]